MTIETLKNLAWKFEPMPDGLDSAEQLFFLVIRQLGREYKCKWISKEQAQSEAKEAERAFKKNEAGVLDGERSSRLWKRIEPAAMAYTKNRTLENADKFMEAVYGVSLKRC